MIVGLIGKKLGYSFSKIIHQQLAGYDYSLIELDETQFHNFMKEKNFDAINVTIPYKQTVMQYCDYIDEKATKIGAVNTVKNVNGKLYATNTDYDGLKSMIQAHFDISKSVVAICGSGATSKTAVAVCQDMGVSQIIKVSRENKPGYISYSQLKELKQIEYIINTTSVGTSPDVMQAVLNVADFTNCKGVIDVVYNPLLTSLCYNAKQMGIPYATGLEMLVKQAAAAVEFFTEKAPTVADVQSIIKSIHAQKNNIVLIGMPSCGKTTIGKIISQKLGYNFVDIDYMIEQQQGVSVKDVLKNNSEKYFRKLETDVCLQLSDTNHTVISCGGGVVKNEINMQALSLNGFVVYIDRHIDKLLVDESRPLSSSTQALKNMQKERLPLYEKYCNVVIENNAEIDDAIDKFMEVYNENFGY